MASPTTAAAVAAEPGRASSNTPSKLAGLARSSTPRSGSSLTPPARLDDDTIENVIQRATAAAGAGPPPGKDTRTQLFVGNLPYRVRWQDLKDLFRKAGTVLRADVSLGPDNRSRGYGTVLLATAEDAGKATDMYNGYVWQNRTLEVRPDRLPPEFDLGLNHANPSILTTAPIANPLVPLVAPQPGHPIDPLTRPMSAALSAPDTAPSPGFFAPSPFGPNSANWANSTSQASTLNRQLFIGNLPFQCQWQDLKDLFRSAGQILRADVALGPDGRSRGFGTVVYAKESDATRAVGMFNGYDYNGRILKVHYDRYSPTHQSGSLSPNSMHATTNGPLGVLLPPPPLQTDILGSTGGMHLAMPQTPEYMVFPSHSQPASPFDQYPPMHSMMGYDRGAISPPPPGARAMGESGMGLGSTPGSPHYGPSSPRMPQPQLGNHPPHPGPISLPPAGVGQFPPAGAMSPLLTRAGGLPPMTPSMPGFNFNPQTAATPPLHAHFLSPGIGPFSPQLHSPPFLPAAQPNPYLNPAPGAPPRLPGAPGGLFGNGPGEFGMHHAPATSSGLHNPYFPPPQAIESGYFAGAPLNPDDLKEREPGNESMPSDGSQLGLDSVPSGSTGATSFDQVEDGLALQLRDVKLEATAVPILAEAPKRPSLGPSRSSLPETKTEDSNDSALGITPPDDEGASVLGLGFADKVKGEKFGPVGSGDRRASWNAATSRSRAGVPAPVP
ncbi:RNA recognition motif protein [Ceratobasidium sp. AG-Ba]|nr:RNA recognition motif protein [Ceratobasidium sp. AG-Ba]